MCEVPAPRMQAAWPPGVFFHVKNFASGFFTPLPPVLRAGDAEPRPAPPMAAGEPARTPRSGDAAHAVAVLRGGDAARGTGTAP